MDARYFTECSHLNHFETETSDEECSSCTQLLGLNGEFSLANIHNLTLHLGMLFTVHLIHGLVIR